MKNAGWKKLRAFSISFLLIVGFLSSITSGANRFAFNGRAAAYVTGPVVTTTMDNVTGSLREAIAMATPGSTITFSVTGTITLTAGELDINEDLTIQGPGAGSLTINGNGATHVFNVGGTNSAATVTISGLTITGGNASASSGFGSNAGGIEYNGVQTLTIADCVISGNTASAGGAGISATTAGIWSLQTARYRAIASVHLPARPGAACLPLAPRQLPGAPSLTIQHRHRSRRWVVESLYRDR